MNQADAIRIMCQLEGLVYHGVADYTEPADCFCADASPMSLPYYVNSGQPMRFMLWAVLDAMQRCGIPVPDEIKLTELLRRVQDA